MAKKIKYGDPLLQEMREAADKVLFPALQDLKGRSKRQWIFLKAFRFFGQNEGPWVVRKRDSMMSGGHDYRAEWDSNLHISVDTNLMRLRKNGSKQHYVITLETGDGDPGVSLYLLDTLHDRYTGRTTHSSIEHATPIISRRVSVERNEKGQGRVSLEKFKAVTNEIVAHLEKELDQQGLLQRPLPKPVVAESKTLKAAA